MPGTTAYGLRYLAASDPPAIHTATQQLAEDTDASFRAPVAQLFATTAQAIPHNVFTAINFAAEPVDTHNGHSTTSNNSRWVCPVNWAGYYLVSGVFHIKEATGAVCALINHNGTYISGSVTRMFASGGDGYVALSTSPVVIQMQVGQYVQLMGEQNSGGGRLTSAEGPWFSSGLSVACLRKL